MFFSQNYCKFHILKYINRFLTYCYREGYQLHKFQQTALSIPFPSEWGIICEIARRRLIRGKLVIDSILDNIVKGTIDFRGTLLPISGTWNETNKHLNFDSPFAKFSGQLYIFDQTAINTRHFILNGNFIMIPPSFQAGEFGQWVAITGVERTGSPQFSDPIPTTAAFLLSNLLYGNPIHFR